MAHRIVIRWAALALGLALASAACGGNQASSEQGGEPQAAGEAPKATKAGAGRGGGDPSARYAVVEGRVVLAEGIERLPYLAYSAIGLPSEEPPKVAAEGCPPWSDEQLRPLQVGKDRGLGPVLVSVVGFRKSPPHQKRRHRVVIRDCRLQPTLVAAVVGDEVEVVNESDYPFLPTLGPSPFMQALPKGQSRVFPLPQGGVTTLYCGFHVPCGWTGVIVQHHPVFAVTKPDGSFRIENVPTEGEQITVHAWHPLLSEASQRIEPKPGETLRVELVLQLPERHRPGAGSEPGEEPAPPEGDEGQGAATRPVAPSEGKPTPKLY